VSTVSRKNQALQNLTAPVVSFLTGSIWARRRGEPGLADFVVGNPQEMPLPGFVDALRAQIEPRANDWFAYQMNDPRACAVVASDLSARQHGEPFDPQDILMTTGAFAGLSVALKTLIDPGDEVIFVSPPWFFYETLIAAEGGVPVRVRARPPRFDLEVTDIADAITERTRAVVINSPNNPTGRIYPAATLHALGAVLERASAKHGRRIYLLSDEAYSRIVFDDRQFVSPTRSYPWSVLIYTYGKTLLTPGQRLGYIALPPEMPRAEREMLRGALTLSQIVTGYAFPNALLQHALPDLEALSIDTAALQRKRDRLFGALREMGYEVGMPEGTFYLLPRAPIADDLAFVEELAERDVFVLPGAAVELPGYFRISLTATDAMIEQALPVFAAASRRPRSRVELASV
jgi:aspartate aminotransferase